MGIPMRQKTILGFRGFSQLQEKLTTHGFQDSWGCLKVEFSTSKNMRTWKFCSPTELFQIATCFPRNLFLVSPGWAGLLFPYSRLHQPVSSLVRTNLGFEMGGAQPIYWKIHASLSLPYVFCWFLRCWKREVPHQYVPLNYLTLKTHDSGRLTTRRAHWMYPDAWTTALLERRMLCGSSEWRWNCGRRAYWTLTCFDMLRPFLPAPPTNNVF